jgi:8-oxo-dGTP pyrophosphatase MutT (NUDIX family)
MSEEYTGRVAATVVSRTSEGRYFLVSKREDNGDWEFPGGKQHTGESLKVTAEREMDEEFNLELKGVKASPEHSWKGGGHEIVPVLATHQEEDLEEEIEEDKRTDHTNHAWIDAKNLGANLENAREKLGEEIKGLEAFDLI